MQRPNKITNKTQLRLPHLIFVHLTLASLLFLGGAVLLIGCYHTFLFVAAKAWTPIFIHIVPTITIISAFFVVQATQPVQNLLALITVFFLSIILYIYAGIEFLAFLFLIVYVGAIAILFLFVIMLLQLKETKKAGATGNPWKWFVALTLVYASVMEMVNFFYSEIVLNFIENGVEKTQQSVDALVYFVNFKFIDILLFSSTIYTTESFLLCLSVIILLSALIGAIVLAISANLSLPTFKQSRTFSPNMKKISL